jgi:hypothetical protein
MNPLTVIRNRVGSSIRKISARVIAESSNPAVKRLWSWLYCFGLFISCLFRTIVKTPVQTRLLERAFENLISHPVEFIFSNVVFRIISLVTTVKEPVLGAFSLILKRIAAVWM